MFFTCIAKPRNVTYLQYIYAILVQFSLTDVLPKRAIGSFLSNESPSFKPPRKWSDVVLKKDLIDMMFRVSPVSVHCDVFRVSPVNNVHCDV